MDCALAWASPGAVLDEPGNCDSLALKLRLKLAIVREVQVQVYPGATARIQQRQHGLRTDLGLEPGKCPGRQHQPDDTGRHKDVPGLAARDKRVDPAKVPFVEVARLQAAPPNGRNVEQLDERD